VRPVAAPDHRAARVRPCHPAGVAASPHRVALAVAAGALAACAAAPAAARRLRDWGARPEETVAQLPGDALLPGAHAVVTRAITVAAPPAAVWPWIAQIGQDRGGFYSYVWLQNALGAGIRNADRIEPAWQGRAVGDMVPGDRRGRLWWRVEDVSAGEHMVLQGTAPRGADGGSPPETAPVDFTWAFVLRPEGAGTRVLVREVWRHDGSTRRRLAVAVLVPADGLMTRGMLRGIRRRAERAAG
jgi:hypothetical protein